MPIRVQLAIQGGGAKIAALMAAMEEIDSLQSDGVIKVTRISGTSAGAIVGALFASGEGKMQLAHKKLSVLKPKAIKKMFPAPWPPRKLRLIRKFLRGQPMWEVSEIELFLLKLLEDGGNQFKYIEELALVPGRNIELVVMAANLSTSKPERFGPEHELMPSLMHSCGLPFLFRTWNNGGKPVIVDGGICENLPSDVLDSPSDVATYGPVIGLSFDNCGVPTIDNHLNFSAALLETSIQNSMERAKQRLGEGCVINIKTDLTTFDLVGALETGLKRNGAYGNVKQQTQIWFTDYIARTRPSPETVTKDMIGDPWANQGIAMMDKLGEVYSLHHLHRKAKFSYCAVIVQARSLAKKGHPDFGLPDIVKYHGDFSPLDETIFCQKLNISDTIHPSLLNRTQWSLVDLSTAKRRVRSVDLPMRSQGSEADKSRELLLFWDPPLEPHSGPYRLTFTDQITDFMKPLSSGEDDDLFCSMRQATGTVARVDVVLMIPEGTRKVEFSSRDDMGGRLLTLDELRDYELPFGYESAGWTGRDIAGGGDFGAKVTFG